jgi:hypothetical protein
LGPAQGNGDPLAGPLADGAIVDQFFATLAAGPDDPGFRPGMS